MKKYIIFDFDGTIANTNDIIIASWQAVFRHYLGHEMPVRVIEATFGELLVDSMRKLLPEADTDEAVALYRTFQEEHQDEYPVDVFDGIRELLRDLRARGCLIGVGTSRTANSFRDYMRLLGLDALVDETVTMNDVTKHKPDPETADTVLLKLIAHDKRDWSEAEELPCVNSGGDIYIPDDIRAEAILIGDTKYDMGCAQNAGIDSVLVGWSHYVDEKEMAAFGAEPVYRLETPAELLTII